MLKILNRGFNFYLCIEAIAVTKRYFNSTVEILVVTLSKNKIIFLQYNILNIYIITVIATLL